MNLFELEAADLSTLDDSELRELVGRLCEAELVEQGGQTSCVTWGGAQEAPDGGLDVSVKNALGIRSPNFIPRVNTGFQVKKHSMGKAACRKEMEDGGKPKPILEELATQKGAYIIVSGKDDCSDRMLSERLIGMREGINSLPNSGELHLDFYGRDRLSAWLRRHPSVLLWVRSRLGKPLAGWRPYDRWAATPLDQNDDLLTDDHPCVIDENSGSKERKSVSEGIQLTRERLKKAGSTVRITGLSGVGKTRFAQALFENEVGVDALPMSDVIYADLGGDLVPAASELVTYLIAKNFGSYLVLDNCPPDVHRSLQKQVASCGAKLRLLTIEYDISDDRPEETEVIHLEPASESVSSKLVQKRYPELGRVNADRIAEFAGGNARVALALASRVYADETLSNFSDAQLFTRLFAQRKADSPELLRSAETLALVYSFNLSASEFNDELTTLGAISGLGRHVLYRDQAELLRRQLAQQRGNWRAILPHALANRLAKHALQNIPLEGINSELFKAGNIRLFKSCAHRLGYLHDFEPARQLALSWVQRDAPLGDITACGEDQLIVLDHVAPIFPDVVLHAIEQAAAIPGFASRENPKFARFVGLLCHVAYEDNRFDRAAEMLLRFAETEKLDENNNSIVVQFRQLFSLHLSGTMATPQRRQLFLKKLIESRIPRHREIAAELFRAAFQAHHWSSIGTFHFGARKRDWGWQPETPDCRLSWYIGYIRLLRGQLDAANANDKDWAKYLLASHFRGLWSFAGCFDELEQIVSDHARGGNWPAIWIAIKKTLSLDGERHTPALRARLESLQELSEPSNLLSEIEAYALCNVWDHLDLRGGETHDNASEIREKVICLGQLAAAEPEILDRLGHRLWNTGAHPLSWFGEGLAKGASNRRSMFDSLIGSFQRHKSNGSRLNLLEGFIRGVHLEDPQLGCEILGSALDVYELKPHGVSLLTTVETTPWISQKLLELAQGGELEAWRFEQLGYGGRDAIPDSELASILSHVNALDRGYLSTIRILEMRWYKGGDEGEHLRAVAREAISRLVSAPRGESNQGQLHGMERVLEEALNATAPEEEIAEIIQCLCEGVGTYRLYGFELTEISTALVRRYPEQFLDIVFDESERERVVADDLMRERVGGEGSILCDASFDRVLAWCDNNQNRIKKIARVVGVYCAPDDTSARDEIPASVTLSEHIKSLLRVATDKLAIIEAIFDNMLPRSWAGSLADILEVRSKAIEELLEYPDSEIRGVVETKLASLKQVIQKQREIEAREHSVREQRFE